MGQVILLCILLLGLTGCNSVAPNIITPIRESAPEVSIYLVPLDDFGYEPAARLAIQLSKDIGIRIRASPEIGSAGLKPYPGTQQFDAVNLVNWVNATNRSFLGATTNTWYVILTRRDLNAGTRTTARYFTFYDVRKRSGIVSTCVLTPNSEAPVEGTPGWARTYKLTKKVIGQLYFGYKSSNERADVMYSPVAGPEDIDRMGTEYVVKDKWPR